MFSNDISVKVVGNSKVKLEIGEHSWKKKQQQHCMGMPLLGCGVLREDKKSKAKKGHNS